MTMLLNVISNGAVNPVHSFAAKAPDFMQKISEPPHRSTDWARKDVVVLSTEGGTARLVCDESILSERALTIDAKGDILGEVFTQSGQK